LKQIRIAGVNDSEIEIMKNEIKTESAPAPAGGHDATPWVGSDTPETDQAEALPIGFWSCATVTGEFARRLERERDGLKDLLLHTQRAATGVAEERDRLRTAMVEALRGLVAIVGK
jgi:hypothetical protein